MKRSTVVGRIGVILAIFILTAACGIAIGWGLGSTMQIASQRTTVTSTVTATNSSEPYVLTLVITTGNFYNSTFGDQPAFFVLGPNGLQSSANIVLPAHRLIKLIIVNYDDGTANLSSSEYDSVTGTANNQMTVVNNTLVNSTMSSAGIQIQGAQTVSSLTAGEIAHTFTVPSLGINVPIATSSTIITYFMLNSPGTYTWLCMTACGAGPAGLEGAMATPGWMTGSLVVK